MATAAENVQTQAYAQLTSQLNLAKQFIDTLSSLLDAAPPDLNGLTSNQYDADWINNYLTIPLERFDGGVITSNSPPLVIPSFTQIASIDVPQFTQIPPSLDIPPAPAFTMPTAPVSFTPTDVSTPTAPNISLPSIPQFNAISIPLAPSINIPSFTSTLPPEDFLTPSNNFAFAEQAYQSALLDADKAKLLDDLINGGYGIEPLDEINVWNRARDREIDTTLMEIDEAYRTSSARGFPLPPADIAILADRAMQKQQDKLSSISREIAIKRADMFVENRKFTLQESRSLENILINFHNAVQERALNVAKATLDASIAIYEAQLKRYNARLEAYKADALVFESKIRAVATQAEIYKTQIQAAQLSVEIQKVYVDMYNSQVRGIELSIELFKGQMEGARIAEEIQRIKIESFKATIDAYVSQVQAEVSRQNAYESQIKGVVAKVQVYEAQTRSYLAQIEGIKAKADVGINQAKASWEQARVQIENFKSFTESNDVSVRAQSAVVTANLQAYQSRINAFSARANAATEVMKVNETSMNNARSINLKNAELNLGQNDLRVRATIETLKIQAQAASIGGSYYANMINALAGSIQSLATVSS